jgi:hypothetical protein
MDNPEWLRIAGSIQKKSEKQAHACFVGFIQTINHWKACSWENNHLN